MTTYVQALALLVLLTPRGAAQSPGVLNHYLEIEERLHARRVAAQQFRPEPVRVEVLPPPAEERAEALDPNESRLFSRLRPHVRQQVQQEMLEALDEKAEGFGGAFAIKLVEFVKNVVKKALEYMVVGVIVALLWKYYGGILAVWAAGTAVVAWIVNKRSK